MEFKYQNFEDLLSHFLKIINKLIRYEYCNTNVQSAL